MSHNDENDFNDKLKGIVSRIIRHPVLVLFIIIAVLITGVVLAILSIVGAPLSFADAVTDAFSGMQDENGKAVSEMTEDEYREFMNDAEHIYQAIQSGDLDLNSLDYIYLDKASTKRIFERIHYYEERRKQEREIEYTYRVETNAPPVYEELKDLDGHTVVDAQGNPEKVLVDEGYSYGDHPMDELGRIDVDGKDNEHISYDEKEKITVRRKEVEELLEGERDLYKIDWQPVFAMLSVIAIENYDDWDEDKMIDNKDRDHTMTLTNHFLSDELIDKVIEIFYYDDECDEAYYYDIMEETQKNYYFLTMSSKLSAFHLDVEEAINQRITKRIPCSAPRLIKNKYRRFIYKYEPIAGASLIPDEDDKDEEEGEKASGGSNVTMIGDSITVLCEGALKAKMPNIDISCANGKTIDVTNGGNTCGLDIAKAKANAGELRDIVVFALGTNNAGQEKNGMSYVTEGMLDQLKAITGDRKVFLVTNYDAYDNWYIKNNTVIRSYAARTPNWDYIDWQGSASPSLVVDERNQGKIHEGVHPNGEGISVFSNLVYDALKPYLEDKKKEGLGPTYKYMRCYEREVTTSAEDFIAAAKAIKPDFDMEFFLNNLEPLPFSDTFMQEFGEMWDEGNIAEDKTSTTTDEEECSSIGTILNLGDGYKPNGGTPYQPGGGKIGEIPWNGPMGAIPYYDVYDGDHSLTTLYKDYIDEAGTVYPGVGTYYVDEDAYRSIAQTDGMSVSEIEAMLGTCTARFNPKCDLFSTPAALSSTAQTLYNCQEQYGISLCGFLAVACHECGNFSTASKNVTQHWNYFSVTGKGEANYTGGYHFINYPVEKGAATPQDALAMQIEWFVSKIVARQQPNYVALCWTGNNPNIGRDSIHDSYCPYWEDYAIPAAGSIYGHGLSSSGKGWAGNSASVRRELEAAAGISGMTTGID